MAKVYKVGVAAMVHDHVWGELNHWREMPNVELVAAADPNAPLREKAQADYGIPRVYESWEEMLKNEDLDIVQAASDNNSGAEIIEACAAKGIHVISEKTDGGDAGPGGSNAQSLRRSTNMPAHQLADRLVCSVSGMGAAHPRGGHRHRHLYQVPLGA